MNIDTGIQSVAGLCLSAPRRLHRADGSSFWVRRLGTHDGKGNAHNITLFAATEAALLTEDESHHAQACDEEARRVHEERHGQGCLAAQGALNGAAGRACEVNEGPPPF